MLSDGVLLFIGNGDLKFRYPVFFNAMLFLCNTFYAFVRISSFNIDLDCIVFILIS
jgi:hypothetical protein